MNCKICASKTRLFARETILKKHAIAYFSCDACGFVQTEEPYWLQEAYFQAINHTDVGLVNRNIMFSRLTNIIITFFFDRKKKFLDYGGGYGLFVRLMRDIGFDFYWYDKFCANLFAKGLEHGNTKEAYEMVTALEIFEHLSNPVAEVSEMLTFSKNILFSTELLPRNRPKPGEWWYYGLEHGQHISFYTRKSLSILAERLRLNLYTNGRRMHLLTEKKIASPLFWCCSQYKIARILNLFMKHESFTQKDHARATSNRGRKRHSA